LARPRRTKRLIHVDVAIYRRPFKLLHHAGWPANLELLHLHRIAQPNDQPVVGGGEIGAGAAQLGVERLSQINARNCHQPLSLRPLHCRQFERRRHRR